MCRKMDGTGGHHGKQESQTQSDKDHVFSPTCGSLKKNKNDDLKLEEGLLGKGMT
jgi:hypothetical protein